jgi:hypothetical protein
MRSIGVALPLFLVAAGWLMTASASLSATVRDLPPDIARFYDGGLYR